MNPYVQWVTKMMAGARFHPKSCLLLLLLLLTTVVESAPMRADFSKCVFYAGTNTRCCEGLPELRTPGGPRDYISWEQYVRENPVRGKRVRRPAHHPGVAQNATYLNQLNRAYQIIRDLPNDDPRSLFAQNVFHCLWGTARQVGFPDTTYSVHINWLFLPFHRMFTFFFERILAHLLGDNTFALPFWNWDNQGTAGAQRGLLPNAVPPFYRDPRTFPALFHTNRSTVLAPGQPPVFPDLRMVISNPDYVSPTDPQVLRESNNHVLYSVIKERGIANCSYFASFPETAGRGGSPPRVATFEMLIHMSVHFFMGNQDDDWRDMGMGYAAVNDPIFFAHHTNVDRLWTVWEALGGQIYDEPDFLDADFFFYNEYSQLVRVTVADALDMGPLGYTYEEVENPWLSYKQYHGLTMPASTDSNAHFSTASTR